ncbi:MAG: hypothetical protein ABI868_06745 [Acidobacteriota bacterium]
MAALLLIPVAAVAQEKPRCVFLCAPELKIEPTWTIENLRRGRVDVDGVVEATRPEPVFELVFALDVPTTIPRVGLVFEAIFAPLGGTPVHPFTGVSAADLGRLDIRDNGLEIESEVNFHLFGTGQTGGWVSSHVDVVDKFSAGETPRAESVYTHKLNLEWDTAFHVFNRLPERHWLRHVEAEVSFDYIATGLPKVGDVVRNQRFLDDASPWSVSFVMVIPLAPLFP